MKPEDFDGEVVDSMKAAASRLGVPLEIVKQCKQQGSRGFRSGRVHLRPLAEMIANRESETDTVLFPVPTGPEASPERISEFRELLRLSIRCGFLRASEIFEILLQQVIDHLCSTSLAATSGRPKRELVDTFDKVTRAIHQGFGIATWLLDDDATDEYLKRSAAALERARNKLLQLAAHPKTQPCGASDLQTECDSVEVALMPATPEIPQVFPVPAHRRDTHQEDHANPGDEPS